MKPAEVIAVLLCLLFLAGTFFAFEVALFRLSCLFCRVPRPTLFGSAGLVLVLIVVPVMADAVLGAALYRAYQAGEYPLWEAGVIQFMLALPIHMALCAVIHAKAMGLRVRDGLSVWFVEKLLKLTALTAVGGVVAVGLLAAANG